MNNSIKPLLHESIAQCKWLHSDATKFTAMPTTVDLQPLLVALLRYCPAVAVGLLSLFLLYAYYVYQIWEVNFGRKRVSRRQFSSPSNMQPPDVKTFEQNKDNILKAANLHAVNFDTCELLHPLAKNMKKSEKDKATQEARRKATRLNSMTPWTMKQAATRVISALRSRSFLTDENEGSLSNETAKELDMDHVYLTYPELLWAYCFIGPNAYFLWLKGVLILALRVKLQKIGLIKPKPFDPAEIVGRLCLEGTLAVHYYARADKDSELGNIAGFFFHSFPYIDSDCIARVADIFAVDIDLDTKKMVSIGSIYILK